MNNRHETTLFLKNTYGVSPALRIHHPIPMFSTSLHPLSGIVPDELEFSFSLCHGHPLSGIVPVVSEIQIKRRETFSYMPCLYC